MATIKLYCGEDGYGENWIEVAKKWTGEEANLAERAQFWKDIIPLLQKKVVACNVAMDDGSVLTDIDTLTPADAMSKFDPILQGFIGGILVQAISRLRALGNASAQVSLPTSDGKK